MRNYRQITFWENRSRQKLLDEFSALLTSYFNKLDFDPYEGQPIESDETLKIRKNINKKIARTNRIVYSSLVPPTITWTPPPAIGGYVQNINIIENYALLYQYRIMPVQILDVLEKSQGVYIDDYTASLIRTFNPFFWLGRLIELIASLPLKFFDYIGLPQVGNSTIGKLIKVILQAILWIVTTFSAVWLFLNQVGILQSTDTLQSVFRF